MTFERAWVLLIAWLPLAWIALERRHTRRRAALALKAGALTAILLAVAQPRVSLPLSRTAVAVLVDTSASIPVADLDHASKLALAMEQLRARRSSVQWMRVIPFARSTGSSSMKAARLVPASGEGGRGTDLEAAVREAMTVLPAGWNPRIALLSDGRENSGSIARGAWQARQLGVPIDTYALSGKPKPSISLESVQMPANAFVGEPFTVDAAVAAPSATQAVVELTAEGKLLGRNRVPLDSGVNSVRLHASVNTQGLIDLEFSIHGEGSSENGVNFSQPVMLRRPRALYITGDTRFLDAHLPEALKAAQFDVTRIEEFARGEFDKFDFSGYQLVIFNNWEMGRVPSSAKNRLESFVMNGGGLLVIGGERNVYPASNKPEDALERVLPAKLLPPRTSEGRAVVLVMDRSTSMMGPKIDYARVAAVGVTANLRPIDMVGVLVFDTSFLWQVPLRLADDREGISWLISQVTPNGGTRIPQALVEAYRTILEAPAIFKHIVLLTDGLSEEGTSLNLAREAGNNAITISTVGLGRDVNRRYLQRLADASGGKAYFMDDPSGLEQIVISDVMEHTGMTAVEDQFAPKIARKAEILDGVEMDKAPMLKGYIRYETKPAAETILRAAGKDPLLSRWQYGLGRAAVFTSDAKPRWAADWVGWSGYDKFWANVARDLLPHRETRDAELAFDSSTGDLVATYHLPAGAPRLIPALYALSGGKAQQQLTLERVDAGLVRGRAHIGGRQGFFRVRPLEDSPVFPEMGLYRPEAELADYGSNEVLLRQVAQFTGGRFQPNPEKIFEDQRSIPVRTELWPGLLGLGIALSLAELVMRKWKRPPRTR